MTTISKTFTSQTGKKVELTVTIDGAKVSGSALIDGKSATVTGYAIVQNRKCLSIKNGPAPYLPIDNALYAEIENAAKSQYRVNMSSAQQMAQQVAGLEAKYRKLVDRGDSNAEIIKAQAAYEKALAEYQAQYPEESASNRVHYNDGMTNNPWTN